MTFWNHEQADKWGKVGAEVVNDRVIEEERKDQQQQNVEEVVEESEIALEEIVNQK